MPGSTLAFLGDLKDETKRGQLGRALAGKIPSGKAYGYDLIDGKTGERRINQAEAAVIRRIFRYYAAGVSPRAIAEFERPPGQRPIGLLLVAPAQRVT